jgi:3-oxoadipate enol-lactonase
MNNGSVDLFYEEMGQGTPLIFVHGFPFDHATWLPVARLLRDKARCIMPDMRGLGKSPVTGTETSILDMATDVIRLMDRLAIQKAVIIGHSMGGYIAMQMAHSFSDRVIGLGLVATRAEPDAPDKSASRLESRDEVLKNGTASIIANMAALLTKNEDILREILPVMEKTSAQGVAMAQYAMVYRHDATPWLEAVKYPVVVIAGGKDEIIPEDELRNLTGRLKNGKYYSSPGASHMIPMEEPGLIARALEETFLKKN